MFLDVPENYAQGVNVGRSRSRITGFQDVSFVKPLQNLRRNILPGQAVLFLKSGLMVQTNSKVTKLDMELSLPLDVDVLRVNGKVCQRICVQVDQC